MDDDFKLEHQVTIGVEFGSFVIKLDEKITKLQIWDTAGQESFRSITRIFYRGAHIVFLCYDITREDTFNNVIQWLGEIKAHASAEVLVYLIGNKFDCDDGERQVDKQVALDFCRANKIEKFFETSAKTGKNVEEVFSLAAKEMYVRDCANAEADAAEEEKTVNVPKKKVSRPSGTTGVSLTERTHKKREKKTCC